MRRRTDRGYRGKSVSLYSVGSEGGTPTTVRTDPGQRRPFACRAKMSIVFIELSMIRRI
jgi:hypothetical protein